MGEVGKGVDILFAKASEWVLCLLSETVVEASVGVGSVGSLCCTSLLFHLFGLLPMEAILVVSAPLFGVGQYFVGLVQLLELDFGCGVVGVEVGMIRTCQLTEGPLDVCLGGCALYAQDLIIVDVVHKGICFTFIYIRA